MCVYNGSEQRCPCSSSFVSQLTANQYHGFLIYSKYGVTSDSGHWDFKDFGSSANRKSPLTLFTELQHNICIDLNWDSIVKITMRSAKNGGNFPDDFLKCVFLTENHWILIQISLNFVSDGPVGNKSPLAQTMARRRYATMPQFNGMYMLHAASMG